MYLKQSYLLVHIGVLLYSLFFCIGCEKELMPLSPPVPVYSDTGMVSDIQGHKYKTVKIGNQWWMAQNLNVTMYNDSTLISGIAQDTTWKKDTTGAYCYPSSGNFGNLYNWYAVNNSKKLAPKGWHVATDEDWKELEQFLGMESNQANQLLWRGADTGNKLKDNLLKGSFYWVPYGNLVYPDNTSGFSALPGGCRLPNGSWNNPNQIKCDEFGNPDVNGKITAYCMGFWWTSTQDVVNIDQAWYRYMDYKEPGVFRYYSSKNYGFSVRCVKDKE